MTENLVATAVRHLQEGDYLIGSRRTVTDIRKHRQQVGYYVVTTRTDAGRLMWGIWNGSTTMTVRRPPVTTTTTGAM